MVRIHVDFRLDSPGFEISALRSSIRTLEEQLEAIGARRSREVDEYVSSLDRNTEEGYGEAQLAYQHLDWEISHTYPRVYRGSLMLLIWAAYESGIEEVAEFVRSRTPIQFRLADVRGRTVLTRATKYFPEILKFDLFSSEAALAQLRQIEIARNAFAHANGRLARISDKPRKTLTALCAAKKMTEAFGVLIPTRQYLQEILEVVDRELTHLVARAKAWDDERSKAARSESDQAPP